jgi:hypothetical protein
MSRLQPGQMLGPYQIINQPRRPARCERQRGWTSYTKEDVPLSSNMVTDMAICPDNRLLVADISSISIVDGEQWRLLDRGWGYALPRPLPAMPTVASG